MSGRLQLVPLDLAEANAFVARHHRHHGPVVGHRFSIGAALGDLIVGVAIIGRPVARRRDDGMTLEVTRLCTDGIKRPIGKANRKGEPCFINAASFLYAAAIRAAWALGYTRIGTYLLDTETGASLTPGAGPRDRSLELAHDRYVQAAQAFAAEPNRHAGDSLRERAWVFWIRRNGTSAGFDLELKRLDRVIARALEDAGEDSL